MAVQAQYTSNLLLFNRSEQERKEMEYPQQQQQLLPGFVDQSSAFFANGDVGVNGNQRKRGRDATFQMVPTPPPQINLFSPSIQSPALMSLAQFQQRAHQQQPPPPPPLVSTGLRLSFEDTTTTTTTNNNNLFVHDDIGYLINQQRDQLDQYLVAQGEQLRRTLAERRQRHYRALLAAAEKSAARRLRLKELELSQVACRNAELEDRIDSLRTESMTWQAKAMSDQATAASLHAQIQQAQQAAAAANNRSAAEDCCGESAAGDAESAHVDPCRLEGTSRGVCRACRVSPVSVVVLPCRHLCMCSACDAVADAPRCPVCHAVRAGSVQVFFS